MHSQNEGQHLFFSHLIHDVIACRVSTLSPTSFHPIDAVRSASILLTLIVGLALQLVSHTGNVNQFLLIALSSKTKDKRSLLCALPGFAPFRSRRCFLVLGTKPVMRRRPESSD